MSIRNLLKLSPFIVLSVLNLVSISARAEGGTSGGGGDAATEMRVDAIRADILKWINEGGGSELVLPEGMTYTQYRDAMARELRKHAVVIGTVTSAEEAATQDPELKVLVRGQPKTCRGFLSAKDTRRHILCNVERFKATSESEQYALIHHEYAGLAIVEKNDGASSDYAISSQVTDYLVPQTVLKLAVRKPAPPTPEQAPKLAKFARDLWAGIQQNKILIPKAIETAISSRSQFAVMKVGVRTQLVHGREDRDNDEGSFIPIWLSIEFDPSNPGNLAFARLRSAVVEMKMNWGGGGMTVEFGEVEALIDLNGKRGTVPSKGSAGSFDLQQYFDITSGGGVQLYTRALLGMTAGVESVRTIDVNSENASALIGEVGVRLLKQVTLTAKTQLGLYELSEDLDQDGAGTLAHSYGANIEWQTKYGMKFYGRVTRMNTNDFDPGTRDRSISGASAGLQINFW